LREEEAIGGVRLPFEGSKGKGYCSPGSKVVFERPKASKGGESESKSLMTGKEPLACTIFPLTSLAGPSFSLPVISDFDSDSPPFDAFGLLGSR
jgi:hypothetical protein